MRAIGRTGTTQGALLLCLCLVALLVPLGGVASADHPDWTCLSVEQTTNAEEVGATHTVAAVLRFDGATLCDGAPEDPHEDLLINFEITSGPHDNDDDNPASPDFVCTIGDEQDTCTIEYVGTAAGNDVIRGWVAHVPPDVSEGVNESNNPGATSEPDETDLVRVTWSVPAGAAATIDCDDSGGSDTERERNPISGPGSNEDYTCVVRDAQGALLADAVAKGENETPVNDPPDGGDDGAGYATPDYSCVTGGNGRCQLTVTPSDGDLGTASICFFVDNGAGCADEAIDETEGNDAADKVELTWEARRAARIEAEPESSSDALGVEHQIVVQVFDQFGLGYTEKDTEVRLEFFQGSPSDKDGNSPGSGDGSCKTSGGSSNCTLKYKQDNDAGTDLLCIFIKDANPVMAGNNLNGTCGGDPLFEAGDAFGSFEAPEAGDGQDVVQQIWELAGLSMSPDFPTARVGDCQAFTVTLTNEQGQPVPNATIDLQQRHERSADNVAGNEPATGYCMPSAGPNPTMVDISLGDLAPPFESPDDKGTSGGETEKPTNANGQVTIGVKVTPGQGSNGSGETEVVAFLDSFDGDDDPDEEELVDRSFLTWTKSSLSDRCESDDAIVGTDGPDSLVGTEGRDIICGLGGDDVLRGLDGNDIIVGGRGNDTIEGGAGLDKIRAGAGRDVIVSHRGNDVVTGGAGNDTIRGNRGSDTLRGGEGADVLQGGSGNDVLRGGSGKDSLLGYKGDDTLMGGGGTDSCKPGPGNNKLFSCP